MRGRTSRKNGLTCSLAFSTAPVCEARHARPQRRETGRSLMGSPNGWLGRTCGHVSSRCGPTSNGYRGASGRLRPRDRAWGGRLRLKTLDPTRSTRGLPEASMEHDQCESGEQVPPWWVMSSEMIENQARASPPPTSQHAHQEGPHVRHLVDLLRDRLAGAVAARVSMRASTGLAQPWACCSAAAYLKLWPEDAVVVVAVSRAWAGSRCRLQVVQRRVGQDRLELLRVSASRSPHPGRADGELVERSMSSRPPPQAAPKRSGRGSAGATSKPPLLPPWMASFLVRVAALDEPLRGRDEVVEDVLFLSFRGLVPGLAVLAAAAGCQAKTPPRSTKTSRETRTWASSGR